MKKLKTALLLIIISLSLNGFTQLSSFDLSKYKLPNLERRTLDTYFNFNGRNNYFKINDTLYSRYQKFATNSYNSNINIGYNYYLNSEKYQRDAVLRLDFLSSFYNQKEDDELDYKNNDLTPSLFYQYTNRKYFNPKTFFETDLLLHYQYRNNIIYSLSPMTNRTEKTGDIQSHKILAAIPLKIGRGRIEQVQDARHAVYILKELTKVGSITEDLSDEDILEFATLISEIKNRRYFDSRLQKIAEIVSVDSFLVSKGYITEQDAKYFTTLNDYWTYGDQQIRQNGTRISFALTPGYYFNTYTDITDQLSYREADYDINAISIDGGFELKHEKLISQTWQNTIDLIVYGGYTSGKKNDRLNSIKENFKVPSAQLGFFQTIGFYPSTRTDAGFRYSIQYTQLFDKTNTNQSIGFDGQAAKAATDLWVNYYISPKFRLYFSLSFYYIWQDSEDYVYINFDDNKTIYHSQLLNSINHEVNSLAYYYRTNELSHEIRLGLVYSIF
ncbi:MAG: hypothetical protein C0595_14425 [Marinilabiliales bacterium]|nr:MAG: hypothetical protein C0595_14425 [Marinilabiliales bacterium]